MHWIALTAPIWSEAPCADPSERPLAPTPLVSSDAQALGCWALRFTPRVVCLPDAVLLEVQASVRLFGGLRALLKALLHPEPAQPRASRWARGPTARSALARLRASAEPTRLRASAEPTRSRADASHQARPPATLRCPDTPLDDLPLETLDEAGPHLPALHALGCRQWGQLRRLPRSGLVRRFGPALLQALDQAYGDVPQPWVWLELAAAYDQTLELAHTVDAAPALMFMVRRLLLGLQAWLCLRHLGVLSLQLEWMHDQRHDQQQPRTLVLGTAEPQQHTAHLERLLAERLQRVVLAAPVSRLRLRTQELVPMHPEASSFFGAALPPAAGPQAQAGSAEAAPSDAAPGTSSTPALYPTLSALSERLASRLGDEAVLRVTLHADARLEARQSWGPAAPARASRPQAALAPRPQAALVIQPRVTSAELHGAAQDPRLWPTWLLERPAPLSLAHGSSHAPGPVSLRAGPQRLEAAHWPTPPAPSLPNPASPEAPRRGASRSPTPAGRAATNPPAALRDYHIAHSEKAGWLWVYRERLQATQGPERWFLHGRFA